MCVSESENTYFSITRMKITKIMQHIKAKTIKTCSVHHYNRNYLLCRSNITWMMLTVKLCIWCIIISYHCIHYTYFRFQAMTHNEMHLLHLVWVFPTSVQQRKQWHLELSLQHKMTSNGLLVGWLTFQSTHYRLFQGRLNQLVVEIRLESHQNHSTMLQ